MSFEAIVESAGLPGVVLGTLIEGEAMAFLAGVLAHRHFFPFELAALAATLGAIIADNLVFALGRFGGQSRLAQKALAHGPVQRFTRALERHGVLAILGFRFVYGLKTAGAVLIGTTSIRWPRFAVLDALACLVWAHLFVALGFAASGAIHRLWGELELHKHLGIALAVGLGAHLLWRRRR